MSSAARAQQSGPLNEQAPFALSGPISSPFQANARCSDIGPPTMLAYRQEPLFHMILGRGATGMIAKSTKAVLG